MRILAILPEYNTSSIVNLITPLRFLQNQGTIDLHTWLENEVTPGMVLDSDVIVTERTIDPTYKPIYQLAQDAGIPIIYDLDDNLFEVPRGTILYSYYQNPAKQIEFEWMLRNSQRVRVHSPVLEKIIKPYNPNTHLVWSAVDWSLVPATLPPIGLNPLEIVYAASSYSGEMFFSIIKNDLMRLLDVYGNRVRLHCLGYNPSELKNHPQVVFEAFESNYKTFFSKFTRHGYAIGLAPTLYGTFYESKTNLKYRDYAAAGAAGVYTDSPLYRNGVVDHKTGLLVSNEPGSWFVALSELIENPALIETIRTNARQAVEKRYNIETCAQMWHDDLLAAPSRRALNAKQESALRNQHWWFNHPRKSDTRLMTRVRGFYLSIVPFRLHIILSHLYHRLKSLAYDR
jgi:hypothetical protein